MPSFTVLSRFGNCSLARYLLGAREVRGEEQAQLSRGVSNDVSRKQLRSLLTSSPSAPRRVVKVVIDEGGDKLADGRERASGAILISEGILRVADGTVFATHYRGCEARTASIQSSTIDSSSGSVTLPARNSVL